MGAPVPGWLMKYIAALKSKIDNNRENGDSTEQKEVIQISPASSPGDGRHCDVATGIMQNIGMKYDMMQELPNLQQKGGVHP